MFHSAQQAYNQGKKATGSGRQIEAEVLFKAARMLEECQKDWNAPDRRSRLSDALRLNQRIWTIFQGELASPEHGLPVEVRQNLLQLSLFIDRRTFELMADPAPEKLTALIDINRQIASGLSTNPS
jgi:flagellar protein FlaF